MDHPVFSSDIVQIIGLTTLKHVTASALGNEGNVSASGHYHAVTPVSSASNRATGRKSNRSNLEKDKGKSKMRHAGRQQRRDAEQIFLTPC